MTINVFIKIGDIPGESRDSRHKDEIEVLSWGWGLASAATAQHGSGGGAGNSSFQDLTFTHLIDKASPRLMAACAEGTHFPEARLTVRRTGTTTPLEFLSIGLREVLVTSVQSSGTTDASGLLEHVTLNFSRADFEYKAQKPDGSFEDGVHFKWDLQNNSTF